MNRSKEKSRGLPLSSDNSYTSKSKVDEASSPFDSGMGLSSFDLSSCDIDELKDDLYSPETTDKTSQEWSTSSLLDSGCNLDSGLSLDLEEELDKPDQKEKNIKILPAKMQTSSKIDASNIYIYQDTDGDTPLHLAVVNEDIEMALNIINSCPYYLNVLNVLYQTPLHLAVLTQQPKLIRLLVVAGAKNDLQDHRGNTPLHWACSLGNYECLRPLVISTIQAELEHAGLLYRPTGLYKFRPETALIRNYEGQTCVHMAAIGGHKVLECLNQCGVDVNIKDGKSGQTALHLCVQTQQLSSVHFLLSRCRAVLNLKNYAQRTPLDLARLILRFKPEDAVALAMVKILLEETKRRQQNEASGGLESQGEEDRTEDTEESSSESEDEEESEGD